jgi:hypothetical protein
LRKRELVACEIAHAEQPAAKSRIDTVCGIARTRLLNLRKKGLSKRCNTPSQSFVCRVQLAEASRRNGERGALKLWLTECLVVPARDILYAQRILASLC